MVEGLSLKLNEPLVSVVTVIVVVVPSGLERVTVTVFPLAEAPLAKASEPLASTVWLGSAVVGSCSVIWAGWPIRTVVPSGEVRLSVSVWPG